MVSVTAEQTQCLMVDLETLSKNLQKRNRAPVEKWDPPFCGDIDIRIASNGDWFYQGSRIDRPELVRLFASVLWHEKGEYFLVTPVEKVRIEVEQYPFVITQWRYAGTSEQVIEVVTNINESYLLSPSHPLRIVNTLPVVKIRDGFLALVHRNVYYQWAGIAQNARDGETSGYYLQSGDARFWLGPQS